MLPKPIPSGRVIGWSSGSLRRTQFLQQTRARRRCRQMKAGKSMEHALKQWKCKNCDRSNETVVALDGTAKCLYCAAVLTIQPSRDYLSGFSLLRPELLRWSEGRWL